MIFNENKTLLQIINHLNCDNALDSSIITSRLLHVSHKLNKYNNIKKNNTLKNKI
jgi:hypothetical protein